MGSDQSQPQQPPSSSSSSAAAGNAKLRQQQSFGPSRPGSSGMQRLQRGNTIASPGGSSSKFADNSPTDVSGDSRPVSPPMSVCSDSDLPYISYTDKPIGDSPKLRNKGQASSSSMRPSTTGAIKKQNNIRSKIRPSSTAHNIVVVKAAAEKDVGIDKDPDIQRLQNIPMFLPVMRGTLSLPSNRDPEILERLEPVHMINMCSRLQSHFNTCATKVAADQAQVTNKVKEVDQEINKLLASTVENQKQYSVYAEQFSKVHQISQQLTRCNTLLNQNIESMEYLNNRLDVDDRLEPFVWKTTS